MSLVELRVTNLGIISELQLLLGDGYTTITGETGAGKTLLVEAVALLLGARADATLVRAGAEEARVEARFVDGDDELVLTASWPRAAAAVRTSTAASPRSASSRRAGARSSTSTASGNSRVCWRRPSSGTCSTPSRARPPKSRTRR